MGLCFYSYKKLDPTYIWIYFLQEKYYFTYLFKKGAGAAVKVICFAFLVCISQHAISQSTESIKVDKPMASWQWAVADQSILRVIAFDAMRQQIIVKIGNSNVKLLKRGDSVPELSIYLSEVYAQSSVFQSLDISGKNSINAINIFNADGIQRTSISFLIAPRRGVVSGWGRIQ